MHGGRSAAGQFVQNRPSQLLPEFHAHLVEGVDVPDRALGEDLVFVQGDQHAESTGVESGIKEAVARFVAGESPGGGEGFQPISLVTLFHQFGARLLESAATDDGEIKPFRGETGIFITPGYTFKAADILITNFHLPRSTLLMLVSAFSGMETIRKAYQHALAAGYRFYSYGDACLLFPERPRSAT